MSPCHSHRAVLSLSELLWHPGDSAGLLDPCSAFCCLLCLFGSHPCPETAAAASLKCRHPCGMGRGDLLTVF